MKACADFLAEIDNEQHRSRTEQVLTWVTETYPDLKPVVKWNQPMFTDHDTYIIGFSVAKNHMAVAPEAAGIDHFADEIAQAGYDHTKQLVRIPWDGPVDFSLIEKMIDFNISEKADCSSFWRK